MAALAAVIVNLASGRLLLVQSKLRVCLAEFHIAGDEQDRRGGTQTQGKTFDCRLRIECVTARFRCHS